ncbi:hypothetical protein CNMCM6936_003578 [Aspergillus lentulus]|uniref:Uncharacterized protein n=1 Tax=Aspergillus lentulus TaxID=293939 RepID=A0AAN5YFQ3_ASPLE|nr:hypothetical protein CNMCM6936_003578 [Aspergillus lentulus]KAF4171482.1 hypothetical protein CNMCM8060_002891 [Aspergillus lentulus]KAF4186945.1 hypothetical protein CNMCM7927_004680 [Aspergillus lentulus]KAF4196272.1 hypothetical protein CNMCM8694_005366 [Aspergillus lentulus]KAF4200646.1 hypothetical protein CNMCM8927_002776 [Aspergillus lentulus]
MYSHSAITTPGKPDSGNPHEVQGANTKGTAGAVDPDTVLSAGKTSARTFETDGDTDLATSSPKDVFHRTTARSTARARLPPRSEGCPRRRARWYLRTRESTDVHVLGLIPGHVLGVVLAWDDDQAQAQHLAHVHVPGILSFSVTPYILMFESEHGSKAKRIFERGPCTPPRTRMRRVTALDVSTAVVVVEDDCVRARDDFPLRNPASNELLVIGKQVAPLGGFEEMHYYRQNLVLRLLREEHLVGEDGVTQSHVRDCELLETTRHQCRVQPREGVHGILPVAAQGCTPGRADSMRCQQRGPHESANMLASILGIERYPGIAEEILTYTTPAQLGYVVDSLMISNTFPYSNRYFNPIRQLVEDGFTILLISSHFDAPMTRIITQRLKALFGHIGEDAQGHTHAHVRQQAGTLDHVPTQEHKDDRGGMNKTMPPHGLYDVPEGFDEMFGASIGWPASTRPRTLRHVLYSFNHTVMMYQPAFVVVPTNQGSVDIRTRFLRIEWTMLLFERQMRDKVAFGYPVHRHNEGTFYIHRHVAERYLTDDGGMLTFFFKMAPREGEHSITNSTIDDISRDGFIHIDSIMERNPAKSMEDYQPMFMSIQCTDVPLPLVEG